MLQTFASHWRFAWLVAASFIAGVMNAMAGGGSFLSFPAMLGVGVPPIQANATNTVALWPGQLTSVARLRADIRRDLLPVVLLAALVGGVCGALILLHTRAHFFTSCPGCCWLELCCSGSPPRSRAGCARVHDPLKRKSTPSRRCRCLPSSSPFFRCASTSATLARVAAS